jgi:hypothetical protein
VCKWRYSCVHLTCLYCVLKCYYLHSAVLLFNHSVIVLTSLYTSQLYFYSITISMCKLNGKFLASENFGNLQSLKYVLQTNL